MLAEFHIFIVAQIDALPPLLRAPDDRSGFPASPFGKPPGLDQTKPPETTGWPDCPQNLNLAVIGLSATKTGLVCRKVRNLRNGKRKVKRKLLLVSRAERKSTEESR